MTTSPRSALEFDAKSEAALERSRASVRRGLDVGEHHARLTRARREGLVEHVATFLEASFALLWRLVLVPLYDCESGRHDGDPQGRSGIRYVSSEGHVGRARDRQRGGTKDEDGDHEQSPHSAQSARKNRTKIERVRRIASFFRSA